MPVVLILKEPNLGTAFITGVVGFSIFVGAGMRLWQIGLLALPVPLAARFRLWAFARLSAGADYDVPEPGIRSARGRV